MRLRGSHRAIGAGALVLAMALPAWGQAAPNPSSKPASRLVPPAKGHIPVAFVLTEGAVMIDFAGPWEVFQDVMIESRGPQMADMHVFELYTVSDTKKPIQISGGMQVVPDYTFDDAPPPRVVVIPAQGGKSPKMLDWIRRMTKQSDVVMSVCTGAFKLAAAGLLDGKKATTHHGSYDRLQRDFPRVLVQRGMRYVQSDPVIFTAGGLSSGIDLALHVVDLYFGREAAQTTARYMEYEGKGWMGDGSATASFSGQPPPSHPSDALSAGVLGSWQGVIEPADRPLRFAAHIWPEKDGKLTGTVDSPDEDASGIAMSVVTKEDSRLHFEVASVGGRFEGRLNVSGSVIEGTWTKGETSLALTLHRVVP